MGHYNIHFSPTGGTKKGSVPSYGGRVPGAAVGMLRNLTGNGAKAVLNCVYGNRVWEDNHLFL